MEDSNLQGVSGVLDLFIWTPPRYVPSRVFVSKLLIKV
jgi:hypothetical protein